MKKLIRGITLISLLATGVYTLFMRLLEYEREGSVREKTFDLNEPVKYTIKPEE